MSKKEFERGKIIIKIMNGIVTRKRASELLGLSLRQIYRLCKKYLEKGLQGLIHKNRGKSSNRKINTKMQIKVLKLIEKHYTGFGPQLVKEQLEESHHLKLSREWIRKLMIEKNLHSTKKRKNSPLYQRRERRSREGELVQIDGSYEKWFENRAPKCCLINMVDDATGKLKELRFVDHESVKNYFTCMKNYLKKHQIPLALYSDRHMIFKSPKKGNITQFGRATKELGIALIHANSPQAKGRVERSFKTLQDRLVKMMRLKGISSIEEGNKYLESFRKDYNKRFGKLPKSLENAHIELSEEKNLNKILCEKEARKVSKNLTVQYRHKTYQIIPKGNSRRLVGKTILLYVQGDKIALEYLGENYNYNIYEERPYAETVMDRKKLEAFLDKKNSMTIIERYRRKKLNF